MGIRQGEVWFAKIGDEKTRPFVIVGDDIAVDIDRIVTRITSQFWGGELSHN